jgi:DNA invertase Pin-like site-specific DNA recombinase
MVQNILIEVLGSFAESERLAIKGRQREGKDSALSRGKRVRRPWIERPDNWEETIENWRGGEITAVAAIKKLDMKKTQFYKMVNEYDVRK